MSIPGADASEEAMKAFHDLKRYKKYKWIIFKVNRDGSLVFVEKTSTNDSWAEFCGAMVTSRTKIKKMGRGNIEKGRGTRYGVFDIEYKTQDGRQQSKIVFVAYCPDEGAAQWAKMIHGGTITSLKRSFGISEAVEAHEPEDLFKKVVWVPASKKEWQPHHPTDPDPDDYTGPNEMAGEWSADEE